MITKTIRTGPGIGLALFLGLAMMAAIGAGRGTAYAADGDLDPAFGGDGRVTTDFFLSTVDEARAVAIQTDGKIVVVGTSFIDAPIDYDFFLARYNPDGSLDPSFSTDGMVTTDFGQNLDDGAYGVAIQNDGKIVAVGAIGDSLVNGAYCFGMARYNPDGSLDSSFDVDGIASACLHGSEPGISVANGVAIQSDGKIVSAGYTTQGSATNFALVRLNPDGSFDTTFDGNGIVTTDFAGGRDEARGIAIQSNGKIVVAGTAEIVGNFNFALARYNEDGSLNNGLSGDGKANFDYFGGEDGFHSLALQPDGKIVAAGYTFVNPQTSFNFAVVRVTSTGSLDTSFDIDGMQTIDVGAGGLDEARGVALQSDGKIVLAGYAPVGGFNDFALVRLHTTGALDPSFNGDGILTHDFGAGVAIANGVAIQADGKIVTAGLSFMGATEFDVAVARYLAGGPVCSIQFPDVPPGSTFFDFVRCLACRGIVSGLPDGTFGVNNPVTRGQLSKIVSNAAGFSENHASQTFEDVPAGSTFHQFVERLSSRGFISGFACGGPGEPCVPPTNKPYFRPNANVTRGQTSKIVALASGLGAPKPGQQTFEDVPEGSTFHQFVEALANVETINGFPCGGPGEPCVPPLNRPYFRPNNNVTRGQASKIVVNTFFTGCVTP